MSRFPSNDPTPTPDPKRPKSIRIATVLYLAQFTRVKLHCVFIDLAQSINHLICIARKVGG